MASSVNLDLLSLLQQMQSEMNEQTEVIEKQRADLRLMQSELSTLRSKLTAAAEIIEKQRRELDRQK